MCRVIGAIRIPDSDQPTDQPTAERSCGAGHLGAAVPGREHRLVVGQRESVAQIPVGDRPADAGNSAATSAGPSISPSHSRFPDPVGEESASG